MIISNVTWRKYEYSTILQLIYLRICKYIYMIISNITWRKYEYSTILHLIIQLIYFKPGRCIYRIFIN